MPPIYIDMIDRGGASYMIGYMHACTYKLFFLLKRLFPQNEVARMIYHKSHNR